MSTVHCPLCGLRFRYVSELDGHAREHVPVHEMHLPAHREKRVWGVPAPRGDSADDEREAQDDRSSAIR